jgi:hypothetical protein
MQEWVLETPIRLRSFSGTGRAVSGGSGDRRGRVVLQRDRRVKMAAFVAVMS